MDHTEDINQDNDKKRGILFSIIFHIILVLLLLLPFLHYFDPPIESSGIYISLGIPQISEVEETQSSLPTSIEKSSATESNDKLQPKEKAASKTIIEKTVESKIAEEKSPVLAEKESNPDTPQSQVEKKTEISEEELEKAEAEKLAREKEAAKGRFGSLFNKNSESEQSTSSGDPLGQPDASALEGMTEAYGKAGEGLDDRGIMFQPTITDDSQKTGRVVVRICVNSNGEVNSAAYTQRGSTTTDSHLIELAERNAKKYRFSKSEIDEQCGNIIIDFKLK